MPLETSRLAEKHFNRAALGGMVAGFVLLIAALVGIVFSFSANQHATRLVHHTYQVTDTLSQLDLQLERAESGRRGYLLATQAYRLDVYRVNAWLAPRTVDQIARLTSDNPEQVRRVEQLRSLVALELNDLDQSITLHDAGHRDQAIALFQQQNDKSLIRQIRTITARMRATELDLLAQRGRAFENSLNIVRLVLLLTGILLALTALGTFILMRRYGASLGRARDQLTLLNTDLEGQVRLRTADLQRANEEIQRFAYIVSHDLRSPLVNVLGFTAELEETNKVLGSLIERAEQKAPEIVTDDVRNAREDLPEAIGFIRSSTQKMDRLINAILKLSREGRRALAPERLPMTKVFDDIVASMEHQLLESGAVVTVEGPIPDVVSDRVAVEQIFSNLIENAVKYLQPGRPGRIIVRGWQRGDRVLYDVEDNGRGIDPKDHDRVFDLFRRSGAQDKPGEGIGLAHVRALAYRLGGFIDLKSELGQGAVFQVNLPVTYEEQGVGN